MPGLGRREPQIFDGAPESLDEDVVECPAATIHRELHAAGEEWLRKLGGRELRTLVGVEDFRHAVLRYRPRPLLGKFRGSIAGVLPPPVAGHVAVRDC